MLSILIACFQRVPGDIHHGVGQVRLECQCLLKRLQGGVEFPEVLRQDPTAVVVGLRDAGSAFESP